MALIKVENLTFSYPSSCDEIFSKVNFQIDTDWKLGFVGRNGRGKTTFLNLLRGKYDYQGRITTSMLFDYFPYEVSNKAQSAATVMKEICPTAQDWEIQREFDRLELWPGTLETPFYLLSNGEQTKVLFTALFLNEGHFLLIDEPTNHLDSYGRRIVSKYLNQKKGFIVVSHDRRFLDGCVDHILSINRADIEVQSGNFSTFMTNFEQRQALEHEQNETLIKDIRRLSQAAQRTSHWSDKIEAEKIGTGAVDRGYIGHRAAKMMKRAKSIERRRKEAIEEKAELLKNVEVARGLKLIPEPYHSRRLAEFSNFAVRYGGSPISPPVSFMIQRGDRIALDGKNGSGKTSLLKCILGEKLTYDGAIRISSDLKISYVPQDTSSLNGTLSEFIARSNIDENLFKGMLRYMGIEWIQFEKKIETYSDGQKKKILMAKSLCERAHLYVWDEPLNYIDIYSRLQIEELILKFEPTMIFVEHDEAFREAVATQTIRLSENQTARCTVH